MIQGTVCVVLLDGEMPLGNTRGIVLLAEGTRSFIIVGRHHGCAGAPVSHSVAMRGLARERQYPVGKRPRGSGRHHDTGMSTLRLD